MNENPQVIVVGGGASGLTAAIVAAQNGATVTVLEQNENPGRKICVTGNGRCNLTNKDMRPEIFRGEHPEIVQNVLKQFSMEDTLEFFGQMGVAFTDRNGWIYPRSNQAKCIPELMLLKARSLKVKIKTREKVKDVYQQNGRWKVQTEGWTYEGDRVILANGSVLHRSLVLTEADMRLQRSSDTVSSSRCRPLQDCAAGEMLFLPGQVCVQRAK